MYSREIEGELHTFGVSGKLIRNVLVMYDRETDTLWSQLLGLGLDGPHRGTELEFVPAVHVTWAEWKEQHPDTIALVKGYTGGYDSYSGYYSSSQTGVIGETFRDDRLYEKELIIGVTIDGAAVAYPLTVVGLESVVNSEVGDVLVLVAPAGETEGALVYNREIDGETYTFLPGSSGTFVDTETQSTWDKDTGRAIAGSLEGAQLERIKSTVSFWFGWKDWYPETAVYGVDA